jgi:hypothetical protein
MLRPRKARESGAFGTAPGDIGVIVIAAIFAVAFVLILFSHWNMPKLAGAFAVSQPAPAQPPGQKGETQMLLFPAPAQKKP